MKSNYGDCYYCGGEVLEREMDLDFRWGGKLFIIEGVPAGVCQQCGEKFLTATVSEDLDRLVKSARIDRTVEVPVKVFQKAVA
jgi:YgiT-type zinc finger domain-containing protein